MNFTKFLPYRALITIGATSVGLIFVFACGLAIFDRWYFNSLAKEEEFYSDYRDCNVAVIPVVDEIISSDAGAWEDYDFENAGLTSADRVIAQIRKAEMNEGIRGVILQVDSGGGGAVGSEMIMNELIRLSKPSVGLIREFGSSGAYLAATGADMIIASGFSNVGGIGVSASYLENSRANEQSGIEYVQLTSAKYKDYGSPDKPMTSDERQLVERDLTIYHQLFIKKIAENRGLPIEAVEKLADGSTFPGDMAREVGIIDEIGDEQTALEWLASQLQVQVGELTACK